MSGELGATVTAPPGSDRRRASRRLEDRRCARFQRELEAARRVSESLSEHLDLEGLMQKALGTALEVVNAESGSILLADEDAQTLVFRHTVGLSMVECGVAMPWDKGLAGEVFRSGAPLIIADVKQDTRHYAQIDAMMKHQTRDMVVLPLKRWEGEPIGVLEVLNKREGRLGEDDLALLTVVSAVAASSIERARLHEEAKLAEVVRLLGDISHDVKNLLMPVVCGAGLLKDELRDLQIDLDAHEKARAERTLKTCEEVVAMLGSSSRRIQDRMKQIADCVKGLTSQPDFAPCRVPVVVKGVFEALSWTADQKRIILGTEGLDVLPEILADEKRLFNALYNLVNNAIPEVPEGGSVIVRGQEDPNGGVVISVADTGRGMPPEIRDSLFTARAKSRKSGGTGLGTKIVKDVVDAHGGSITVTSEPGRGTTFYLRLPLRPPMA